VVDIALLVSIGVLFFVGFLLLRHAQANAPNMGMVNAISYASVAATFVLTHVYFGDAFEPRAIAGCALVVAGIALIGASDAA
jgi:drug/metabolite transporter (DMT)-like permease